MDGAPTKSTLHRKRHQWQILVRRNNSQTLNTRVWKGSVMMEEETSRPLLSEISVPDKESR